MVSLFNNSAMRVLYSQDGNKSPFPMTGVPYEALSFAQQNPVESQQNLLYAQNSSLAESKKTKKSRKKADVKTNKDSSPTFQYNKEEMLAWLVYI